MNLKFFSRFVLFMIVSSMLDVSSATPPPHAPTFCSQNLCLEAGSIIPQPEVHRVVTPSFSTSNTGDGRRIRIDYNGFGTIVIAMPSPGSESVGSSSLDAGCTAAISCPSLNMTIEGSSGLMSNDDLKCKISMIWVMQPYYRVIKGGDVAQSVDYIVATRRSDSRCIGLIASKVH
ncbi:hypothetical protein [Sphingomonas sp.]|uniref:hypothetical protein n=1 Tax=Sphingomonas sp. TaxID=28214 RepID=UPI003B3B8875